MNLFVVVQAPPINTSWQPCYLSAFEGDGSGDRSWRATIDEAHLFADHPSAERVAAGIRTTFDTGHGWNVDVREVQL
jgi:hypothetical protein